MYKPVSNRSVFPICYTTHLDHFSSQTIPIFYQIIRIIKLSLCFNSVFNCGKMFVLAIKKHTIHTRNSVVVNAHFFWFAEVAFVNCTIHGSVNVCKTLYRVRYISLGSQSETVQCTNDTEFGAILLSLYPYRYLALSSLLSNVLSLIRLLSTFLSFVRCFPLSRSEFYPMHQHACCLHTISSTIRNTSGKHVYCSTRALVIHSVLHSQSHNAYSGFLQHLYEYTNWTREK